MMTSPDIDPALESLLAFWADAGVDAAVEDEPVDKLQRRGPVRAEPAAAAPAAPAMLRAGPDVAGALADARALAAGAATLEALLAAADDFALAGVRPAGARGAPWLRGEAPADVVVIGGPPGADEETVGAAFGGIEGRLVDRMLAAAGLSGRALLAHAVLWRTPGDRPATHDETLLSRPFLERAVQLARPKALLVLGDAAARLLLGRDEGVLKLRRESLTWRAEGGEAALPAVVTFGPGLLLRQAQAKKRAWEDVLTLLERVEQG